METKENNSSIFFIAVIFIIICTFILVPHVFYNRQYAWDTDASQFLGGLKKPLREYIQDHHQQFPDTLAQLYPEYTKDSRVLNMRIPMSYGNLVIHYQKPVQSVSNNQQTEVVHVSIVLKNHPVKHSYILDRNLHVSVKL